MCTLFLAYKTHPNHPLVLLLNRDEFYHRPTAPIQLWKTESQDILSGIDEKAGGTWLGSSSKGELAVITNYRHLGKENPNAPSRGQLVKDFLVEDQTAHEYGLFLQNHKDLYNGYNLIWGDLQNLYYFSNIENQLRPLEPGIYGLSNHFLDTPWPKVQWGKNRFSEILKPDTLDIDAFFEMMENQEKAPDQKLPHTGLPPEKERLLSSLFIESQKLQYGTRSTTLMIFDQNKINVWEKDHLAEKPALQKISLDIF